MTIAYKHISYKIIHAQKYVFQAWQRHISKCYHQLKFRQQLPFATVCYFYVFTLPNMFKSLFYLNIVSPTIQYAGIKYFL